MSNGSSVKRLRRAYLVNRPTTAIHDDDRRLWVVERHRIVGIRHIPVVPAILKLRQNRSLKPSQLNSGRRRTAVKDAVKRQRP